MTTNVERHQRIARFYDFLDQPYWAYGASFDRNTELHVPESRLKFVESRYVVDDLVKRLTVRVAGPAS